jgi:hypothetical protein
MERAERLIQILNFLIEATFERTRALLEGNNHRSIGVWPVAGLRSEDRHDWAQSSISPKSQTKALLRNRGCAKLGHRRNSQRPVRRRFRFAPRVLAEPLGDFVRERLP